MNAFNAIDNGQDLIDQDIEMATNEKEEKLAGIKNLKKFKILIKVLFDANEDDNITISEFMNVFVQQMGYEVSIGRKLWEFIDKDKRGSISLSNASAIFADDNPHFEVDYFVEKMQKFINEIYAKRVKKEAIAKQREEKVAAEIAEFEKSFKKA